MKGIISIFLAGVLVSALTLIYFVASERNSNSFENYQALYKSGLIQKGWVPEFIPKSAYNIKENHRVDNEEIYVEFHFIENDNSFIKNNCKKESQNIYNCENSGYPVQVVIKNGNHVTIQSI